MSENFELLLFSTNLDYITAAIEAGIDAIVVDWEHIGKAERQHGLDTQINYDTVDDLKRIRQVTSAHIICRINNIPHIARQETATAIVNGANEILVPMVRHVQEIEPLIQQFGDQAKISLMVETLEAIQIADELAQLPLHRVYVGLHDLALQCHFANIFENVRNGTVEQMRRAFQSHQFGFGGLTIPTSGDPIPSPMLMQEMTRLNCGFTFLRRSFLKDVTQDDLPEAVPAIRHALAQTRHRTPPQIEADTQRLFAQIAQWEGVDG